MGPSEPAQTDRGARMRRPRQGRSEDAVGKIAKAVISLLASQGQGALTHRRVAEIAGVSLAATTYYYPNKFEMIADAQARLLDDYVDAFVRAKARHRAGDPIVRDLPELVLKLVSNAAGRHGRDTLAWSEIMLDCARDDRGHRLARAWFERMEGVWRELIVEFGAEAPDELVNPAIDTAVGLLFVTVSLQLSAHEVRDLLDARRSLADIAARLWKDAEPEGAAGSRRPGERSQETRERIVGAAVWALEAGDPAGLSFSAIAQRAGLTNAAPAYHFPTLEALLARAEDEVLRRMIERSALMMASPAEPGCTRPALADLLATFHIRSLLEDGSVNLAGYGAWLTAARRPERRAGAARAILAFEAAFAQCLEPAPGERLSRLALIVMAQVLGRSVRMLATGCRTWDLAQARREFDTMIRLTQARGHPILRI